MNELLRRVLFLPAQRSTIAQDVDGLHYFVIGVTMAGSVLVFLAAAFFVVRYRRPHPTSVSIRTHSERPSSSIFAELGLVVLLIGLFLNWWSIGSRLYLRARVPPESTLDVYVTAKQWMWKFLYADGRRSIAELYVPAGRPIKLIMTSRDVIHSFFVPHFRVKEDVLPGRYTTLWFEANHEGRYPILCAEYCGASHSRMRGEVVVLDPAAYERWLSERPSPALAGSADEPMTDASGGATLHEVGLRAAADRGCLRCHTTDGSAHVGPTWGGAFGSLAPLEGGGEVVVDEAYITESIMDPAAKIHRGYRSLMPSFFGRLPAPEVGAIVELIKSLRQVPRQGPGGADPGPAKLEELGP